MMTQPEEIRAAFRAGYDPGDSYACVMAAWFDICEALTRRGYEVPPEWQFRPGSLGVPDLDDESSIFAHDIAGADPVLLVDFGNVLRRWSHLLDAAGRSY